MPLTTSAVIDTSPRPTLMSYAPSASVKTVRLPAVLDAVTLTPSSGWPAASRLPITRASRNEWSRPLYGSLVEKSTSVSVLATKPARTMADGTTSPGAVSGSGTRLVVVVRTRSVKVPSAAVCTLL